jgi:hypothetical protein
MNATGVMRCSARVQRVGLLSLAKDERERALLRQTVRKLQELSIEWRKERAGRNFGRFRPN